MTKVELFQWATVSRVWENVRSLFIFDRYKIFRIGAKIREIDVEKFRSLLLKRRDELAAVNRSALQAAQTVILDQTRVGRLSRMDALQQQAISKESNRRRKLELKRIIDALSRINDREYSNCVNCDKEIASNRLRVDPAATLCIDCANRLETGRPR